MPVQRRQPRQQVVGGGRHVEVGGQVVQRADDRREDLVERAAEPLDEGRAPGRARAGSRTSGWGLARAETSARITAPAPGARRRRPGPSGAGPAAAPDASRRPVSASAGNSVTETSWAMSTPGIRASAACTSWDCTDRPNGHPVPSGPPVSGSSRPYRARSTSSCTCVGVEALPGVHVDDDGQARRSCGGDHQDPGPDQPAARPGPRRSAGACPRREPGRRGGSGRRGRRRRAARPAPARPRPRRPRGSAAQCTRAASGATSRASWTKSSAVTARPRDRSSIGPRTLASSRDSASDPPTAARPVLDPRDVGDARLQHAHLTGRDVAAPPAAAAVRR